MRLPDQFEPRYYALPWSRQSAIELQKAIREADRTNGEVVIRLPFESSYEGRELPRFYALPHARLPLKPTPDVQEYRHPSLSV